MSFDARILTGVGVLAAVTETGNFARAAEALGLTPSGVRRAVARLEEGRRAVIRPHAALGDADRGGPALPRAGDTAPRWHRGSCN